MTVSAAFAPMERRLLSARTKAGAARTQDALGPLHFFDNQENILALNGRLREEGLMWAAIAQDPEISRTRCTDAFQKPAGASSL